MLEAGRTGRAVGRVGEEADEQRADETADEVDADHVEAVVEAEPELESDGQGAADAGRETDDEGAHGETVAQAGVMATRPATTPDAAPSEVAWPSRIFSVMSQPSMAVQVAPRVLTQTPEARVPALRAEPALNPNQPNQRMPAPIMTRVRLCGRIGSLGHPTRLRSRIARARPAIPALMWMAVPPAKSYAPAPPRKRPSALLAIQPPVSAAKPLKAKTQWAAGK